MFFWNNCQKGHTQEVLGHFKGRDDLLVVDITAGDGWEKLCDFLERPVPQVSFPHNNNRSLITWSNAWDAIRSFA